MKKSYIKPEVQVISYTLNDAIAASSCAAPIMNHSRELECKSFNERSGFPFKDVEFTFGQEDSCTGAKLNGYCYFTSTYRMLFSS